MPDRCVVQGECAISRAASAGVTWERVWQDPENAHLVSERQAPGILMEGDDLHVPDVRERLVDAATERTHRFVRTMQTAVLRLRLRRHGRPVAHTMATLTAGERVFTETGDAEGRVAFSIPPEITEAILQIAGDRQQYLLRIGWLDPIDETSGVQARLFNLGFDPGPIDNDFGGNTRRAMQQFQVEHALRVTRGLDQATRDAVRAEHGG